MNKKQTKKNHFNLILDNDLNNKYFKAGEDYEKSFVLRSKLFEDKKFRVSDTCLNYRKINSLDSSGLLDDSRSSKSDWRQFSLKELIYFLIIRELRIYGFRDAQLKVLRKVFFGGSYRNSEVRIAFEAVLAGIKVILVVNNKMGVNFYNIQMFKPFEQNTQSFVTLNFNEVVMGIMEKIGEERIEYKNEFDLMEERINKRAVKISETIGNKDHRASLAKKDILPGGRWSP